jgi:hypothetical protein
MTSADDKHVSACHPELSEGSLSAEVQEILRCAEGDGHRGQSDFQSSTGGGRMRKPKVLSRAFGFGALLSLLVGGCVEPSDRIEVHNTGEGRFEITHVTKEPVASPAPTMAAASPSVAVTPSQPPQVVTTPAPSDVAAPVTLPSLPAPTDEASKQRRIDDLQKKVQEMNAEIERLKTPPATAP